MNVSSRRRLLLYVPFAFAQHANMRLQSTQRATTVCMRRIFELPYRCGAPYNSNTTPSRHGPIHKQTLTHTHTHDRYDVQQ